MKGAGEEDETPLFSGRFKLFLSPKDGAAQVVGLGDAKVCKNGVTGKLRILMRSEGAGKILLNSYLSPQTVFKAQSDKDTLLVLPDETGAPLTYVLRGKPENSKGMLAMLEKLKAGSA